MGIEWESNGNRMGIEWNRNESGWCQTVTGRGRGLCQEESVGSVCGRILVALCLRTAAMSCRSVHRAYQRPADRDDPACNVRQDLLPALFAKPLKFRLNSGTLARTCWKLAIDRLRRDRSVP